MRLCLEPSGYGLISSYRGEWPKADVHSSGAFAEGHGITYFGSVGRWPKKARRFGGVPRYLIDKIGSFVIKVRTENVQNQPKKH